jgi:hypothetical protein
MLGLLNCYRLPATDYYAFYVQYKITPNDVATSAGRSSVCLCATLCQRKNSLSDFCEIESYFFTTSCREAWVLENRPCDVSFYSA